MKENFDLTFTSHKTEDNLNHVFLFALFARGSPGRGATGSRLQEGRVTEIIPFIHVLMSVL